MFPLIPTYHITPPQGHGLLMMLYCCCAGTIHQCECNPMHHLSGTHPLAQAVAELPLAPNAQDVAVLQSMASNLSLLVSPSKDATLSKDVAALQQHLQALADAAGISSETLAGQGGLDVKGTLAKRHVMLGCDVGEHVSSLVGLHPWGH